MKGLLIVGLWWVVGAAGAQQVYKCRDAAGAVVYQSAACTGTTEKQWTVDPGLAAAAPPERIAADRSIARDRRALQSGNRPTRRGTRLRTRQTGPRTAALGVCERARRARADAHARKGVRWSFDDASRWDARVFKVCR